VDLGSTQRAFDAIAPIYDGLLDNAELALMRDKLRMEVLARARPGARLLDLGCGTGIDAGWFAGRGYSVIGVDLSPEMVRQARRRIARAGLADRASAEVAEIASLSPGAGLFDVAYSNFGPLNCVVDLGAASRAIASRLTPGGVLIASVMGRLCPWEVGYYLVRGRLGRATVRLKLDPVAVPLGRSVVWTRYVTPGELIAAFRDRFEVEAIKTLQLFRSPPYLCDIAERHPRLFQIAGRIEDRVAQWPVLRSMGDSFLAVLRRA
jgi:SAM-dependent methyltransferase